METPTELFDYISSCEGQASWRAARHEQDGLLHTDIHLMSQIWRGTTWNHELHAASPTPSGEAPRGPATLLVTGPKIGHEQALCSIVAGATGRPCAVLYDVPNQPLFDKVEDALIAHTFVQYLNTGEPDWPLLFPMTQSVCAAISALDQELFGVPESSPGFLVTGASKRGWTTWLTGIADQRVVGIAPMVYDNLNIPAQLPHQVEASGGYSDEINDYVEAGLPERLATPDGQRLTSMVDPYTYRELIVAPKLLIHGSNDPYWMTDALSLYYDGLFGPRNVLYIPNAGHGLGDMDRLLAALIAFSYSLADGAPLPLVRWSSKTEAGRLILRAAAQDADSGQCWSAAAPGRDFRSAVWTPQPLEAEDEGSWMASVPAPDEGCVAAFAELRFARPLAYSLSTGIEIGSITSHPG